MNKMGIALVISGPSGVGKGTLVNMLRKEFPSLEFSISYTTRSPREGEVDGKDYFFVSKEKFKRLIEEDFFAEWARVHSNYYGTPKEEIERKLKQGIDVVFDIDVQGARQLKKSIKEAICVFIMPPSVEELRNRLKKRSTETEDHIEMRLQNALEEMKLAEEFDYIVVNDNLSKAYETLRCIFIAQHFRTEKSK